ncbi:MAPEG family protein [Yangia mangrovi]|uniref:MAPEG family protein n=1 Tax=Alloyangia mangrovi TaxID=1779329 RepID=A0A2A3JS25_9RHOB|nr:MAPEG family protein [Alloyangia mangrovi]MCA0939024.1 MAPEG family protein [Alloyangia pacifica]MCA0944740.1 MAPEG family protein [Alloyangia pacifica]MCT4373532.1 MAPEG family protein [Alloyangia mangrovi]
MTPELLALTLATLLQMAQMALYSVLAQRQVGPRYAASPRDEGRELTGLAGRAQRAMNNHFEGLLLFAIAVTVVTYADKANSLTALCALLYLAARIVYLPAYLLGWTPWRSLVWFAGFLATAALLIAALVL